MSQILTTDSDAHKRNSEAIDLKTRNTRTNTDTHNVLVAANILQTSASSGFNSKVGDTNSEGDD